jgi:hypothetical protein
MKRTGWAWALLMALPFLAGCSGFWDKSTTTTTPTTTTTTLSSGYFYILDTTTSQIVSFNIVSGTLTEIGSYAIINFCM